MHCPCKASASTALECNVCKNLKGCTAVTLLCYPRPVLAVGTVLLGTYILFIGHASFFTLEYRIKHSIEIKCHVHGFLGVTFNSCLNSLHGNK